MGFIHPKRWLALGFLNHQQYEKQKPPQQKHNWQLPSWNATQTEDTFPSQNPKIRDPFFSGRFFSKQKMPGEPLSMLVTTCRKLPQFHASAKKGFEGR